MNESGVDHPTTWNGNGPIPPQGTIVAAPGFSPFILEGLVWRCVGLNRVISCPVHELTRPCVVLRWGTGL